MELALLAIAILGAVVVMILLTLHPELVPMQRG